MNKGDKVRIIKVPEGCCGVLQLHWTEVISYVFPDPSGEIIVVLKDDSLHWSHNLEVIK